MKLLQNLIVAFSMYSKIPMPHIEWTKDNMRYTLCFFPLIGAVIGALEYIWYRVGCDIFSSRSFLVWAIMVLIPVAVSGGIHLDGLLDTADALSSWQTRERRLEILKDSHAGAFAIIVCCSYFLAQIGIWSEADVGSAKILGISFILSRALSGLGVTAFKTAKNSGLAAAFASAADRKKCRKILIAEAFICMAVMIIWQPVQGICGAAAATAVFFGCRRMAYQKFGGTTGDIQGFFLQICELVMAYAVIVSGRLTG